MSVVKPKILIFDLDYTLWAFWVDTHVSPPFKKNVNGDIVDSLGRKIKCYPEVPQILNNLYKDGYIIAVASRTGEIKGARQLVELFGWDKLFKYKEIFPGSKITHINNIQKQSGVNLNEMIFFDDEHRNIRDLKSIGVVSILVNRGITKEVVEQGLFEFSQQRS